MKVIGIRPCSFNGSDGSTVSGVNLYLTEQLSQGEGYSAERVFVTQAKLNEWTYSPAVGDKVELSYNRYGKVGRITKI